MLCKKHFLEASCRGPRAAGRPRCACSAVRPLGSGAERGPVCCGRTPALSHWGAVGEGFWGGRWGGGARRDEAGSALPGWSAVPPRGQTRGVFGAVTINQCLLFAAILLFLLCCSLLVRSLRLSPGPSASWEFRGRRLLQRKTMIPAYLNPR